MSHATFSRSTRVPEPAFPAAAPVNDPLAKGYEVPGITPPLVLDLRATFRLDFLALDHLLGRELDAGRVTDEDAQPVKDLHGRVRYFRVRDVRTMLMGYFEYCGTLVP